MSGEGLVHPNVRYRGTPLCVLQALQSLRSLQEKAKTITGIDPIPVYEWVEAARDTWAPLALNLQSVLSRLEWESLRRCHDMPKAWTITADSREDFGWTLTSLNACEMALHQLCGKREWFVDSVITSMLQLRPLEMLALERLQSGDSIAEAVDVCAKRLKEERE